MIKLGDKVKDTITGFEGTAIAKCTYLFGCKQIQVEGVDNDKQPKAWWFDEQRVKKIEVKKKEKEIKIEDYKPMYRTGGPQDTPIGRSHPNRNNPGAMTSDRE